MLAGSLLLLADSCGRLEAVQFRHLHIHEHEVEAPAFEGREHLPAVADRNDFVPESFKRMNGDFAADRIILGQQQPQGSWPGNTDAAGSPGRPWLDRLESQRNEDGVEQLGRAHRLNQIRMDAEGAAAADILSLVGRRKQQDNGRLHPVLPPKLSSEGETVHPRHRSVEQDQLKWLPAAMAVFHWESADGPSGTVVGDRHQSCAISVKVSRLAGLSSTTRTRKPASFSKSTLPIWVDVLACWRSIAVK